MLINAPGGVPPALRIFSTFSHAFA
jgi:hypothetical protein